MTNISNGGISEQKHLSIEKSRTYGLGYDIWLVIIFLLGLAMLNYLILLLSKLSRWCKTAPMVKQIDTKVDNSLATAALGIMKESKKECKETEGLGELQQFNQYIKENKRDKSLDPYEILNKMSAVGIAPDIVTYNSLMDACILSKNFQKAYQLFMEMKEYASHVIPDVATYNIYIKGVMEAINAGEPVNFSIISELLSEMEYREIYPNQITFNSILEAFVVNCRCDLAWEFFEGMQTRFELKPDFCTYSILLKGVKGDSTKPIFFEQLYSNLTEFLLKNSESIDETLVNSIIDACGKFKEFGKLDKIIKKLRYLRYKFTVVNYGRLITLYGQEKMLNKVQEYHYSVIKDNLQQNEVTYGCLMDAYLRCGRVDIVTETYQEMEKCRFEPKELRIYNPVVYTTLIKAYGMSKDFARVLKVFEILKENPRIKPNLISYNAMLDACVKCEEYTYMEKVFAEMVEESKQKEGNVIPDLITYSTLLKGLCKTRNVKKALELYEEMKRKKVDLDEVLFNSLLDGISKIEINVQIVDSLIKDMKTYKIKMSNYTYSILIKLFTKAKDADRALNCYEDMKSNNVKPGVIVFTCLLQVCIKFKRIERAIQLYYDMKKNEVEPDHVAYNTIVNGCIFSGKLQTACEILCESIKRGIKLAEDIYNNVLRNLLTHYKMPASQKHLFATEICNYISVNKIPVSEEYMSQVMNKFVFQQATQPVQAYNSGQAYGYMYYPYYQQYSGYYQYPDTNSTFGQMNFNYNNKH